MNKAISPIVAKVEQLRNQYPMDTDIADLIIGMVFNRGEYNTSDIPSLAVDAINGLPEQEKDRFVSKYGIVPEYSTMYRFFHPYVFLLYMVLKLEIDSGRNSVLDYSTADIEYISRKVTNMELFDDIDRLSILDFYDALHAIVSTVYDYSHASL